MQHQKLYKALILLSFTIILSSCGNPVKILKKQIRKNGYIMFPQPIEDAGLGTLLGGKPSSLVYAAHSSTCFNSEDFEEYGNLKKITSINLPTIAKTISTSGAAKTDLLNVLGTGTAAIKAGIGFKKIQRIHLSFEDVTVEYMDLVLLKRFYNEVMDQTCKDFLDSIGFVIQALKVGKMKFTFTDNVGANIELNYPVVSDLLNLGADLNWEIQNDYTLIVTTPKYLGYQLGQLRPNENGISLYRAVSATKNKFKFKSIDIFTKYISVKRMRQSLNHIDGIYKN